MFRHKTLSEIVHYRCTKCKKRNKKKREIAHVIVFFLLINLGVPAVFVAVWAIVRAALADAR